MNNLKTKNFKTASFVLIFLGAMFFLAFASVPLYDLFCKVTGYGGTPKKVKILSTNISEETIKIRFNADLSKNLNFYFQPVERQITTKLGESNTINYEVFNNTNKAISVTSTYNITPQKAGLYFNKIECFCYEEKTIQAGQKLILPVTFFINPEISQDPNTKELRSLTLSYTFFNIDKINVSNLKQNLYNNN